MNELFPAVYNLGHVKYLRIEPLKRKKMCLTAFLDSITLVSRIQDVAKAHGFSIKAGEATNRILSLTHPQHKGVQIVYIGREPIGEEGREEKSVFRIEAPAYLSASTRAKIVDFLSALKEKKRGSHLHLVK